MPSTFPSPFPAHQGLVYPLVRRWPHAYDVLALSVGAAMPDLVDIACGYMINGYFRHWFAHSLIFIPVNVLGGLLLTWLITLALTKWSRYQINVPTGRSRLALWTFSISVGVVSHLGFDLISHDTNLLLYPWHENVRWFPSWWYATWYVIPPPYSLGPPYQVGVHTIIWLILSSVGTFLFYQYVFQKWKAGAAV